MKEQITSQQKVMILVWKLMVEIVCPNSLKDNAFIFS